MDLEIERTLTIIKPDALKNGVSGRIITLIEENGLRISAMKMAHLSDKVARAFYSVHADKPFFTGLIEFMTSGPSLVLVLEGKNAVERWRSLMGPTDPGRAPEGTVRRLFGSTVRYNAVHGSDSPASAVFEIGFFFPETDLLSAAHYSLESI